MFSWERIGKGLGQHKKKIRQNNRAAIIRNSFLWKEEESQSSDRALQLESNQHFSVNLTAVKDSLFFHCFLWGSFEEDPGDVPTSARDATCQAGQMQFSRPITSPERNEHILPACTAASLPHHRSRTPHSLKTHLHAFHLLACCSTVRTITPSCSKHSFHVNICKSGSTYSSRLVEPGVEIYRKYTGYFYSSTLLGTRALNEANKDMLKIRHCVFNGPIPHGFRLQMFCHPINAAGILYLNNITKYLHVYKTLSRLPIHPEKEFPVNTGMYRTVFKHDH